MTRYPEKLAVKRESDDSFDHERGHLVNKRFKPDFRQVFALLCCDFYSVSMIEREWKRD